MSVPAWFERRVLVCVGTGGVGKTTLAAGIGLAAARHGKRVLVMTIDPARRLADALCLGPVGNTPQQVPDEHIVRAVGGPATGSLFAMTLDTRRTFDALVERYAATPESRRRIFENVIYRNLTDALSGSREYAAMEEVLRIHAEGEYDLLVLDTPPAQHALEFLDAPRRLVGFLENPISRLLVRPALAAGRTPLRWFQAGSTSLLRGLERISGLEFLATIGEFLLAFEELVDGFSARAHEVQALFRSAETGFLLVAGPHPAQATEALHLSERLTAEEIDLVGILVNRVRCWPGTEPCPAPNDPAWSEDRARLAGALRKAGSTSDPTGAARMLIETAQRQAELVHRDERGIALLANGKGVGDHEIQYIPLHSAGMHSLELLAQMSHALLEPFSSASMSGGNPPGR